MRLIPRALHPRLSPIDEVEVSYQRRTLFERGAEVRVRLKVYEAEAALVAELGDTPALLEPGSRLRLERPLRRVCRYHEGPRGDPLAQKWCHSTAVNGSWCQRHRASPLALYERCAAGNDEAACRAVDALWRGEEYVVYLVYHGAGYKVGMTRAWRLYTRLLEQPHIAAAIIARLDSALKARRLEKRLAARGPGEGIGVSLRRRMTEALVRRLDAREAALRLAEGIAMLGLGGEYEAVALRARCPEQPLLSPTSTPPHGDLEYVCVWGGVVVFRGGGVPVGVRRDAIIHREFIGAVD